MSATKEDLAVVVAQLTRRVDQLEAVMQTRAGEHTEGFEAAARLTNLSAKTVRLRTERNLFPKPLRTDKIRAGGKVRLRPVWRTADLLAYRN